MKNTVLTIKSTLILLLAVSFTNISAQAPNKMSYQAVVRDANNTLVKNQAVGVQISILQGNATGTSVYSETHAPSTNDNGLFSIEIGGGSSSDDFSTIDWSDGPYFIKSETDPTGGTNYTITGTSQLMSVPYAFHAKNTDSWTRIEDTTYTMNRIVIGPPSPHKLDNLTIMSTSNNAIASIRSTVGHSVLNLGSADNFDSYLLLRKGNGNTAGWSIFRKGTDNDKLVFRRGESSGLFEYLTLDISGNFGIGTTNPSTKLHLEGGDTYMSTANTGVILTSPNGSCFRLTVDNSGSIISTPITCP